MRVCRSSVATALALAALSGCSHPGTPAPLVEQRVPDAIAISAIQLPATTEEAGEAVAPAAPGQATYESPEAAARGLMDAVRKRDREELTKILGPNPGDFLPEGKEGLQTELDAFALSAKSQLRVEYGARTAHVYVGRDQWPFPIPVAHEAEGKWYFDATAGRTTMTARRIGGNELRTIEVLRAMVDAEREYQATVHDDARVREFAARVGSARDKHDGLYWASEGGEQSPLGPRIAEATVEEDNAIGRAVPYHGYLFRLLAAQGENAPGGAYSYVVNDRPLAGFAIVAFPAKYRASGVTTFIVSNDGRVYQKDLGVDTEKDAMAMTTYDPDESWVAVGQ